MLEFHERQRLFMLVSLLVCLHLFALLLRSARPASWLPLRQNRPGYRRCAADAASPQRTDPGCPWQNGRVERFFGTLKERLDWLAVDSLEALNAALGEFRFFYNHVRSHQNLAGRTPAEAWAGVDPFGAEQKNECWFDGWDGLLTGYYLPR